LEENSKYHKFMTEKKQIRICIIKNFDIIGFEESVFDNKFIFSVESLSDKGEFFKINKEVK